MKCASNRGNILVVAMIMIVVISGFVGVAVNVTNNSSRITDRSRDYAGAQSAAEGAVEYAYGVWAQRIRTQSRPITTAEANAGLTGPSFPNMSYSTAANGALRVDALDEYGAPAANATPVLIDLINFPGWRGMTYNYSARAKVVQATPGGNVEVGVRRQFQYSQVPLFQAMYFFEHDIEIYRPAEIIVAGLVHTNSFAYLSGWDYGDLTFQGNVSYVNGYSPTADPPYVNTWLPYVPNAHNDPIYPNGAASQVKQVSRMEPLGADPASVLNTADANPNNDSMREIIEPPTVGYPDPPEIQSRRLYGKAGMVININGNAVTVTGKNGLTLDSAQQAAIKSAISAKTTIFDQREGKTIDVTTVNIDAIRPTLNSLSGFNEVLYIHDTTPVNGSSPNPKAVRLKNGGILPDQGLTVASENAVYIQGDYNTGTTNDPKAVPANNNGNSKNTDSPTTSGYTRKPAAVIGDAVMLLSNGWDDSNSSLSLNNRKATNTTFNTAIVSGYMPSGYQPAFGSQYGYSGGAINYPRFLEDWSSRTCTYYGSMVELFTSKSFTGRWDLGNIYKPPARRFNFDTMLTNNAPPGSVSGTSCSRGTWAKY